jgi:hypothetical protein
VLSVRVPVPRFAPRARRVSPMGAVHPAMRPAAAVVYAPTREP